MNNSIYLDLLHNAALLLAIAFIFNITLRKWQFETAILGKILVGALMGIVCIALMATPWTLEKGIIFDTRSVLLCISGLFFGAIPTIITMIIAISYRIVLSGTAAVTGVSVILASGLIGLAWRHFRKTPLVKIKNWELYLIGIIVHIVMLALMLLMPYEKAIEVLENISLPVLIIYPIATVLLGILIRNQLNEEIINNRILQSEENLSITLHSISDAVVSTDENGNVVMMNPAAEKILGYKIEEAKGNKFCNYFKIYDETTKEDIQCPVNQVLASGKIVGLSNHTILVSKDGKEYNISDGAAPIKDFFGNIKGVVIVFSDVSDSHKARKDLTESEKRFRSYIDNAPDGVFITDNQGNFVNVNRSATIMSGYSQEELSKLNLREIVYEEDLQIGLNHFQTIIEKGEAFGNFRFKLKDGSVRNWSVRAVKITDNTILGFASDITEEIILKEKLKASDRVFNYSVDMLCTANYDGYFTHLNPAWEKTLGWDLQTLLSKPYKEFIHADDIYGRTIDEIDLLNYRIRFLCKDGTFKWLSWNIYPYPEEKVIFAVARDITKLKENEIDLKESEKKYRTLFENMNEAFALHEIILDENNEPVDYRFIEINSVFEELTGLKREEVIGKRVLEVLPKTEENWIKTYGDVALTGKSVNFYDYSKELNKFYNIKAFCPQKGYFAVTFTDITEQKLAEQTIKESEERYRSLFENNHAVMMIIDPKNGEIIEVNPAAVKFYRWSREELLQKKISEINILSENDVQKEMNLAQQEKRNCFIFKHLIADGTFRDVEVYSGPITINEKPLLYSVIHDITVRKKAEELVRESEERYNRFINTHSDIIFVKDDALRYVVVNDAFCKFLNKDRKDILLKTDYQLMPKENADSCKESDRKALLSGKTYFVEEQVGNQIFEVTKFPIKLSKGKIGVGAIIKDITEQRKFIEKIKTNEARFRGLVENAFDGIYLIRDKKYEFVNEKFCEITGYTREELLSEDFDFNVLLTESSKELMRKRYEARYSHQELSNLYEIEIVNKNNEKKALEVSTVVLEDKESILVLGIMRDITERKIAEVKIKEDSIRQQKYNKYISELIKDGEFVSGKFSDNLRKIVKAASVMLDTERVGIWIYNQNYTEMYCKTLYEKSKDSFSKGLKLFTNEFPNYVEEHKSGRIIAVENVYEDPITNQISSSYFIEKDTKSLLDAPV
ncbi:MAG TPA: PAS domain S-box protein, partial [Candidatus Kapabacteria bacterium]|nr:PAS domain S-box protein [Candidatus Kapabacteria bacterium]